MVAVGIRITYANEHMHTCDHVFEPTHARVSRQFHLATIIHAHTSMIIILLLRDCGAVCEVRARARDRVSQFGSHD